MVTTQGSTADARGVDDRDRGGTPELVDPERVADRARLRGVVLVVLAAVVLGALLRVPLAHGGLPYLRDPDEPLAPRVSSRMIIDGRVNAGYYNYPGLMFDLGAVVLLPFVDDDTPMAAGEHPVAATQTQGNSVSDRPGVLAALRWTVGVLPGLIAVAAAGIVVWLASRRWWAAGLAAGLMALSPLDLAYGRYVTPNALAGATSGLVVLAASWLLLVGGASSRRRRAVDESAPSPAGETSRPPRRRTAAPQLAPYLLAGGAVGLAASAKYNAVLAGLSVVVAHVLAVGGHQVGPAERPWRAWSSWARWREVLRRSWLLLAAGGACLVVFLVLNPGALIDGQLFVDGVQFESEHYRTGHPGNEGDSLAFHLSSLWRAFGPALLLSPLSLLSRDRRARRVALVVWSFVLPYLAFISSFEVRFARNLLPVTVPLAATTALGVVAVAGHARHLWLARVADGDTTAGRTKVGGPALAAVTALCLAVLVWPAVEAGATMDEALPDPWAPAQRWLESHVPEGERVAVESYGVFVDPGRFDVLTVGSMMDHDAAWYRDHGYVVLVASERNYQRFLDEPDRYARQATGYQALLDETCTRFAAGPEDARVVLLDPSCANPESS